MPDEQQPERHVYDAAPPLLFSVTIGGENIDAYGIPLGTMLRMTRIMYDDGGLASLWLAQKKRAAARGKKPAEPSDVLMAIEQMEKMIDLVVLACHAWNPKVDRAFLERIDSSTAVEFVSDVIRPVIERFVAGMGTIDLKNL